MTNKTQNLPHCDVVDSKQFRKDLDIILQEIKGSTRKSRNRSLTVTHLEDAIMRLGMDLKDMKEEGLSDEPNAYPNSYKPENGIIEPTADGLKL